MTKQQGNGPRLAASLMHKMHIQLSESIDIHFGSELRHLVELGLLGTPVVASLPAVGQAADISSGDAITPVI